MNARGVQDSEAVERLSRAVEALEHRVKVLEGMLATTWPGPQAWAPPPATLVGVEEPPPIVARPLSATTGFSQALALLGRTLVVLGGAYLLRALSDADVLAPPLGIAIGLLYAAAWLTAADRARTDVSAIFHALAATLIAMPIVWEATLRFGLLNPESGVFLLGISATAAIGVAVRRDIEAIAWLGAIGTAVMSVALAVGTRSYAGHATFLILLGIATLWLGYLRQWVGLRWPVATLATVLVAGVVARGAAGREPLVALLIAALFLTAYLASFAARTLFLGRAVIPFEVAQSLAVLVVGLGGAVYVTSATGASVGALGLIALALGLGTYAVAFAFVERRRPPRNFFFYSSLSLTFVLVGTPLAGGVTAAAAMFAALAMAAAVLAYRYSRVTLSAHAAVYAVGAAGFSGLLGLANRAVFGAADQAWRSPDAWGWLALAAVVGTGLCPAPGRATGEIQGRLPRSVVTALAVWLAAGVAVTLAAGLLGTSGRVMDSGAVAAIRTIVFVTLTLLLAWGSGPRELIDGGWLVSPMLGLLALKLAAEDLPQGRPLTLMAALAAYGLALILVPRLRQGSGWHP